jgi:hypothetical protein
MLDRISFIFASYIKIMTPIKYLGIAMLMATSVGCNSNSETYTLYRSSVTGPNMRIHLATFDVDEPGGYNQENCFRAAELFQSQPNVLIKFWCEKGRLRN